MEQAQLERIADELGEILIHNARTIVEAHGGTTSDLAQLTGIVGRKFSKLKELEKKDA